MVEGFDYSVLDQKPNYWLPTSILYIGDGIAEFQDPKGRAWGKTRVVFDECSEYSIEMQVEGWESEKSLPLGLQQLISRTQPKEENGKLSLTVSPSKTNLCKKLTVQAEDGEFLAENIEFLSFSFGWDSDGGQRETLYFHPRYSYFEAKNSKYAQYWVMPLINFISDFMQYEPSLGNHPLRIYPDSTVPNNIPPDRKGMAEYVIKQKSHFILFEFQKSMGFIEALPDYKEKVTRFNTFAN